MENRLEKFINSVFQSNNLDRNDQRNLYEVSDYRPDISYNPPDRHVDGFSPSVIPLSITFKDLIFTKNTPLFSFVFLVDSKNRIKGTSENYIIQLPFVMNTYCISLIHSNIKKSQYLIDNNTEIYFEEVSGDTLTGKIPHGDYTDITTLMDNIVSSMNAVGSSNYTYTILNSRLTIQSDLVGGIFNLDFSKQNLLTEVLGYNEIIYSGGSNYTSTKNYNLTPQEFVILSLGLGRGVVCNFGEFNGNTENLITPNTVKRIETLNVSLLNYNGSLYSTNGAEHSLLLKIKYII